MNPQVKSDNSPAGQSIVNTTGRKTRHAIFVWLLASVLLFISLKPYLNNTLMWDEVDYIQAASQGYISNATDKTAFSASDFVRFVQAKFQNRATELSPDYDETRDVFQLRHTHPPLLQYSLGLLGESRLRPGYEFQQHFVHFAAAVVLIASMLWGYMKIAQRATLAGMITVAAAGVLCGFFLGREMNCHLWIAISLPATCVAVGRFITEPSPKRGIIAGCWIGLNFLGLQTGIFVAFWAVVAIGIPIFMPATGLEWKREMKWSRKFVFWIQQSLWMLAGFTVVLLITYPGAIFRLSLLRIFASYAYLIMKGSEYREVSNLYEGYLQLTFPILILGLAGLMSILFQKRAERWYLVFATAVIGFGYGVVLLKFLLNITYITPVLVLLAILGAASVSSWNRKPIEIAIAVCMCLFTVYTIVTFPFKAGSGTQDDFARLASFIGPSQAMVEGGAILQYYAPEKASQIIPVIIGDQGRALTRRNLKQLQYETITFRELGGCIVVLGLFNGQPLYEWEKKLPPGIEPISVPGIDGRIYRIPRDFNSKSPGLKDSHSQISSDKP